ncbi:MAG: tetratricopeptide repeat protein [candidate division KSB1 bacterium]|nr:tetratricopeptide repeat protein [candidate division KSB1 bacterium]MDZ7275525.1 tetratricopeptide repeat protein [candidate division KSB1 bacterium]MDZ7286163.1 tetratricopeptide repeat protein [candidate division KSB1 bacterium]MDZ7296389.1 tetratricopeptide repeat protein [candidate division KSB1 bacterium]MDZ7306224.1 tetratricopeptide repeat protein [candidate division KSB1 bacterium]
MQTHLGWTQKLLFHVLLALSPLAILGLVELGLRLAGYGEDLSLFVTLEKDPKYWLTNPKVGRRYFLRRDFLPATSYDAFLKQKPGNSFRIFVLGESAAAGFPHFNNGAFSRMLREHLQETRPDLRIEMVNLALPAVSSYALLDLADELPGYAPDAVLVYAGHNEFYGAFGSASTESAGRHRGWIKLYLRLQHFKLVQLLQRFLRPPVASTPTVGQARGTMMARLAKEREIPRDSELYALTCRQLQDNLDELVARLQSHGIKVMLSDLPSNLSGLPPFASLHETRSDRAAWQRCFAQGMRLAAADSCAAALAWFDQAAAIDSLPAQLHFERGKCLLRLGQWQEARAAFIRARDLDGLRFRASSDFNRIIHAVGRRHNLPVLALADTFAAHSPHGIIDNTLLFEHVHPNLDGHLLIAKTFGGEMQRLGWLPPPAGSLSARDTLSWRVQGVTALDEEVVRLRLAVLTSNWPFTTAASSFVPLQYQPQNRLQELAYALLREETSWDQAHARLADHYLKSGQPELAAREYQALAIGMPYVVAYHLRLGLTYLDMNRLSEAWEAFARSLAVEPTALAYKWLGTIAVHRNELVLGLRYLHQALQQEPNDPESLYNLSIGYAKSGDFVAARQFARQLLQAHPRYPGAAEHWQRLQAME